MPCSLGVYIQKWHLLPTCWLHMEPQRCQHPERSLVQDFGTETLNPKPSFKVLEAAYQSEPQSCRSVPKFFQSQMSRFPVKELFRSDPPRDSNAPCADSLLVRPRWPFGDEGPWLTHQTASGHQLFASQHSIHLPPVIDKINAL
jgi:hypothetical protein